MTDAVTPEGEPSPEGQERKRERYAGKKKRESARDADAPRGDGAGSPFRVTSEGDGLFWGDLVSSSYARSAWEQIARERAEFDNPPPTADRAMRPVESDGPR